MSYHTVILVGNLGRDPEMRYTPDGQPVTNFSVAVNDDYTSAAGEKVERTIWLRVSTWGKLAEVCAQYLKKGRKVLVEGRLIVDQKSGGPRVYTRQDGSLGTSFEVRANVVRFLTPKGEEEKEEVASQGEPQQEATETETIPF